MRQNPLSEDWDYTSKGLARICQEGVDAIATALRELEQYGYLARRRLRDEAGDPPEWGNWSDGKSVQYFKNEGVIKWLNEPKPHGFKGVPATEYMDNEERMGIFERALLLIDAYNKAISEKANDVDYFADVYLKVLGSRLEEDQLNNLRSKRIINSYGADSSELEIDFLQKPDSDTAQENLLDRLERLIFQISMIANLSDQDFGVSASGVSLQYKLQSMYNLAKTKEMKFRSGINRLYMLIFSNPVSGS